ncbi:Spo0E family sporulation regulatory protein-aspartic acid phosphatase [Paenibacillus terreus]|uniref:Spo0E family sporulation regulatory protein-aspartic acid phosphatase n=1 Tax=Paenibacillus terreus TaxID=1387834 RepID=UPI0035CD191A
MVNQIGPEIRIKELEQEIEQLRQQLNEKGESMGVLSREVLQISQQLDVKIVEYMALRKSWEK